MLALRDQALLLNQVLHDYRNSLPFLKQQITPKQVAFEKYLEDRITTIRQQINAWETYRGHAAEGSAVKGSRSGADEG